MHLQEIPQQVVAVLGQDRLRVELYAFDRQRLVPQAHDFVDEDLAVLDGALERLLRGDRHQCISRKFRSRSWPCWVRIDSGWNCTPSIGNVLCRRPMISSTKISRCSMVRWSASCGVIGINASPGNSAAGRGRAG